MSAAAVVIPAHNSDHTIARCLSSPGLRLGGKRPRLIVADNGSTDRTVQIAHKLGADVIETTRPGAAAARNAGLQAADSEYVAFIDSDCAAGEGWLDRLVSCLDDEGHVGAGGALHWTSSNAATIAFYTDTYPTNEHCVALGPASYLLTANAIFRREVVLEAGGFNPSLNWCEDLELGVRLAQAGATLGWVPEAVVEVAAPAMLLDQLAQSYKYGVGLDQVTALHGPVVDWSPRNEWQELMWRAPGALFGKRRRLTDLRRYLVDLAYFAGWLDARTRRMLRNFCRAPRPLPVIERIRVRPNSPRVVLTIDDGPSDTTGELLELLDRNNATATFFINGARAATRRDQLGRIAAAGHEMFAHGWSHRRFDCLSRDDVRQELESTESLLQAFRGTPQTYLVRLPYGAGSRDEHVHAALRRWHSGCRIVQWTRSLDDWKLDSNATASDALRRVEADTTTTVQSKDLDGAILLAHDEPIGVTGPAVSQSTHEILDQTLRRLHAGGYEVVSTGRAL